MHWITGTQTHNHTLRIQNLSKNLHKPKIPFVPRVRGIEMYDKFVNFTRFLLSYTENCFWFCSTRTLLRSAIKQLSNCAVAARTRGPPIGRLQAICIISLGTGLASDFVHWNCQSSVKLMQFSVALLSVAYYLALSFHAIGAQLKRDQLSVPRAQLDAK